MRLSRLILFILVATALFPLLHRGPTRNLLAPSSSHSDAPEAAPAQGAVQTLRTESITAGARRARADRVASTNAVTPSSASGQATKLYGNAAVLEAREQVEPTTGRITRHTLYKTQGKYPFLRAESVWRRDPITQRETLVTRSAYVADHIVLEAQPGVDETQLRAAIASVGGTLRRKLNVDYAAIYLVGLPQPSLEAVPAAVRTLRAWPHVARIAEPDAVRHLLVTPNDSRFLEQWSLRNIGQSGGTAGADISAPAAWDLQTGQSTVVVGVLDSGIDYNHNDLRNNIWSNSNEIAGNGIDDDHNGYVDDVRGWNFVSNNNDPQDDNGHGTHVAGTIGASGHNGLGIAGVCWNVKLMPVKVGDELGLIYTSDAVEGFDYARQNGAHILNCSFGGASFTASEQAAINRLEVGGVLVVASAGNDSENNDQPDVANYPSSFPNENIIAVANSDDLDHLHYSSSYGLTSVDLAAPGTDILSAVPGNGYGFKTGTSMASPHVVGVAALLKAQHFTWDFRQVRNAILSNVDAKSGLAGKCVTGGRLNAYRAFRSTLGDALEAADVLWNSSTNAPWEGQGQVTHDGTDAAQSATIGDGQATWIEVAVNGPGQLTFWWKVSSQTNGDVARFLISGVEQDRISGETDWQQRALNLVPGSQTLRWEYAKDASGSGGQDRAWVDQVVLTVAPTITSQPSSVTVSLGENASFSVSASGSAPLLYQWRKDGTNLPAATNAVLALYQVKAEHGGLYSVAVANALGTTVSSDATLGVCAPVLSPKAALFPGIGGTADIMVSAPSVCPWVAHSPSSWVVIQPGTGSGLGNGVVSILVRTNTFTLTRTARLYIEDTVFNVTQTPLDPQAPIVSIIAPAANARFTNAVVQLRGTANDNVALTRVECQLGHGAPDLVTSTNNWANWSGQVSLSPGTNLVRVKGVDTSGNESPVVTRSVVYVVVSPLTLQTNGAGSVAGVKGGQLLEVSRSYQATATAKPGFVFVNWTGDITTTNAKLSFVMSSNLVLQANFIPNPFIPVKGTYTGLFYETNQVRHESSGAFNLTLTDRGTFAVKLLSGGRTLTASGRFDLAGRAGVVARADSNAVTLDLQVDLANGTDRITGSVNGGTWLAELLADRSMFSAATNPAPFAGKYTLALPGGDGVSSPGGDGVGAVSVDAGGKIRLSGTLAEGSPIMQTAPASKQGDWPMYVSLYGGKGSLLSWLTFTNGADAPSGFLSWIKPTAPAARYYPAGFTNDVTVLGSPYLPPIGATNRVLVGLTNGIVIFSGSTGNWTNEVFLAVNNKVTNISSNKLTLTITLPSGLFQGSVVHPVTGKPFSFKGALHQSAGNGNGYFLTTNQSSAVYFGPVVP